MPDRESHLSILQSSRNGDRIEILSAANTPSAERLCRSLIDGEYGVTETFKDTKQTYIARISINGEDLVVKVPRDRNTRKWQRFLSLFRPSDAFRHFQSMLTLQKLGLHGPEPVAAVQTLRGRKVVDSMLMYRYLEGRKPVKDDIPRVTNTLTTLHRLGYLRRDPHAKNFLVQPDRVAFIDFRLSQPVVLKQLRLNRELCAFLRTTPEGINHLEASLQKSFWFKLALKLDRFLSKFKRLRRSARKQSTLN